MAKTLFRYNSETCQYERVKLKTPDVVFYISGVVVFSIVLFISLLIVHDYFFDSAKEIALRTENQALERNHKQLKAELSSIETSLVTLKEKDEELHRKFFGNPSDEGQSSTQSVASQEILLANPSVFREKMTLLNTISSYILTKTTASSAYFTTRMSMKESDVKRIASMPNTMPIKDGNIEQVISGFGTRINPFHKGLYHHNGLDISAARGSSVIATSAGTVVEVKRNTVQAGYGNYVVIDHGNGFTTRYAHLDEIFVRVRERVQEATNIGTVGSSGGSIAPHLHYEVIKNGKAINPVHYIIKGLTADDHFRLTMISQKQNQSLD